MTRVKVCGITCLDDLKLAIEAGVDAMGFVVDVPASPRNIDITIAKQLVARTPIFVTTVLVTVAKNQESLVHLCEQIRPDALQVHGDLPTETKILRKAMPDIDLICVVHAEDYARKPLANAAEGYDALLCDSKAEGREGGTGRVHDWAVSRRVRDTCGIPFILAGGLNPENVAQAIRIVRPYGVDVSTGVELVPGRKDGRKIAQFVKNTRET